MMVYDLIMIVILVAATLWGIYKGLAWQVASLGSIVASYFVAYQFRGVVASYIDADPPWNMFLSMLILYLGTSLLIWIAFRLVKNTIDRVKLHEFDKQVGGVLGLAKGVVLCVIVTLFAITLMGQNEKDQIVHSHSGYYIALLLYHGHALLPNEMNSEIDPLLHSLDERLPEGYAPIHDHDHHAEQPTGTPFQNLPSLPGNSGNYFGTSTQPDPQNPTADNGGGGFFNRR